MKICFSILLFVMNFLTIIGQDNTQQIEKLKRQLNQIRQQKLSLNDTTEIHLLNSLVEITEDENEWVPLTEEVVLKCKSVLLKSDSTQAHYKVFARHLSFALANLAEPKLMHGEHDKALAYCLEARTWAVKSGDLQQTAFLDGNIGYIYQHLGNAIKALEHFYMALKVNEKLGHLENQAANHVNIGALIERQGDFENAMKEYKTGAMLQEKAGDKSGLSYSLNNIAVLLNKQGNYKEAHKIYLKSYQLRKELNDVRGIGNSLINLGNTYLQAPDSLWIDEAGKAGKGKDLAIEHFRKALEMFTKIGYKEGIYGAKHLIASYFLDENKLDDALKLGKEVLTLSEEIQNPIFLRNSYMLLHSIYNRQKNYKLALETKEKYVLYNDSINSNENKKAGIKSQLKYEYEKKATADSVKVAEEKKVVDAQLKQEKTQRFALYGGLALVFVFALFMVNRFRITNRQKKLIEEQKKTVELQKHLVEEKQKEVLDSIYYASRIQKALITNEHYIASRIAKLKGKI